MTAARITALLARIAGALATCFFLVLLVPLGAALLFSLPLPQVMVLISSTLLIEYGAAPVGIGLGLPAPIVFLILTSIALGVTLLLFAIFDLIGDESDRVKRFLDRSRERARSSRILGKYGIYGLPVVVITLGFYVCPPIAWVLGWDRPRSIALILAGYCAVTALLLMTSEEILGFLVPHG